MALLNGVFEATVPAVLVGVGAVLVAPIVLPAVGWAARPLAKAAVKGYLWLEDIAKEWFADASEQWSDLVAEARAEHKGPATARPVRARRVAVKAAARA